MLMKRYDSMYYNYGVVSNSISRDGPYYHKKANMSEQIL